MPFLSPKPDNMTIGHRLDGWYWINQKWHPRARNGQTGGNDTGLPCPGGSKYIMCVRSDADTAQVHLIDSNRNWTSVCQDIVVLFDRKMNDASAALGSTLAGHYFVINSTTYPGSYQGGTGTSKWTFRVPKLCSAADQVTYYYSTAAGNTTAIDSSRELDACTITADNVLTRRIRFTLYNSAGSPVANEAVKMGIFFYNSGAVDGPGDNVSRSNPAGGNWMRKDITVTATTDANGMIDYWYTGYNPSGTPVYVGVIRPSTQPAESLLWVTTVM